MSLAELMSPGHGSKVKPLQVGVGALTFQEQRAHFAIWAIMKSPLMLGTDLTTISKDQLDMVSAPEVKTPPPPPVPPGTFSSTCFTLVLVQMSVSSSTPPLL